MIMNWTKYKIMHSSIEVCAQFAVKARSFMTLDKKSVWVAPYYLMSFFWHFQTHIPFSSLDEVYPVCPEFFGAEWREAIFRASATGLCRYLLCNNLSESSSYLCVPCSVFQKMTTFVRQAGQDNLPSCPDRVRVREQERNENHLRFLLTRPISEQRQMGKNYKTKETHAKLKLLYSRRNDKRDKNRVWCKLAHYTM